MIDGLRITVEGSPEEIQRLCDTIDLAYPGALTWADVAEYVAVGVVRLEGWGGRTLEEEAPRRIA